MFILDEVATGQRVLSVADGPSTLNFELRQAGFEVFSVDPRYACTIEEMVQEFKRSYELNRAHFYENRCNYSFGSEQEIEELLQKRETAFDCFLADFTANRANYHTGQLPSLAFANDAFDLCLCANFLFLFDDLFDLNFHLTSIIEMARVAKAVRIFPLYGRLHLPQSPLIDPVLRTITEAGLRFELRESRYHVWRGSTSYLHIHR